MASLKVRRKRNKFHISAPKLNKVQDVMNESDSIPLLQSVTPIPNDFMKTLSFVSITNKAQPPVMDKGVGVVENSVERHQEEDMNQSTVIKKQMKKKDKRKLRHEKWMQKIEACQKAKEMAKAALKRKRTVIVGDLQPLLSSLPEIEDKTIPNTTDISSLNNKKRKKNRRLGTNANSAFKERELFQQVLAHPSYQSDPMGTITVHIKNTTSLNRI